MEILSNGFFKNHHIEIDYYEEHNYHDWESVVDFYCDEYNFDLRDFNIEKHNRLEDEGYYANYYILYNYKTKDIEVLITIYEDFGTENELDTEYVIKINTEEEKKIFKDKLDTWAEKHNGSKTIDEYIKKEMEDME